MEQTLTSVQNVGQGERTPRVGRQVSTLSLSTQSWISFCCLPEPTHDFPRLVYQDPQLPCPDSG